MYQHHNKKHRHNHNHHNHHHHDDHSDLYDWVNRQVDLPLISFTGDQLADLDFKCGCGCDEHINDICDFLEDEGIEDFTVECFLSDKCGHPLSLHKAQSCGALLCKELEQACGRKDVEVKLPNGKKEFLQVVKVLVKGYVGVKILDEYGEVVCKTSKGIHFATVQTFYLCAPEGTELECKISFFECDAALFCKNCKQKEFEQLDLSISLCLDVRMVFCSHHCCCCCCCKKSHCHCHPREELESVTVCPTRKFPPSCPQIFPVHN